MVSATEPPPGWPERRLTMHARRMGTAPADPEWTTWSAEPKKAEDGMDPTTLDLTYGLAGREA